MSTITRELAKLFRKITNSEIDAEGNAHVVLSPADSLLINNARIALASLEAEPVAWAHRLINKRNGVVHPWVYGSAEACPSEGDIFNIEVMPLYTAPPAPVSVPDEIPKLKDGRGFKYVKDRVRYSVNYANGWNQCRAAMLQAGNSPVTPDDVRRMDWLVSKTVNVREPMVYGSHSLFWSQTITDEEDDYHATKLREQIDEAMAAERAAAPQQEA
ncbi:TPA: hypothetical protein ACTV5X_005097 [Enterobacter roggenkampii]|jgi:hypothetical protein|uniref:hypothetical protein n=1 Tax=Enterobacter cloacae complex TaxID=354276 RepID=UPI00064B226C|nr:MULTISPECIES: hypothetical protein [Enterobacter cloacae complex]KLP50546.1 hypothetical protein ABF73_15050 [Enterobacter roggenkampii]DAQ73697.1 MAG TPA: hypothetical protein [Caudoviricetes sp.]HCR1933831.1 hypothetical protein [Enterobacter roggenkampii]HDT2114855.1 hypothetical protein [Enterobacter roggenkampii]